MKKALDPTFFQLQGYMDTPLLMAPLQALRPVGSQWVIRV